MRDRVFGGEIEWASSYYRVGEKSEWVEFDNNIFSRIQNHLKLKYMPFNAGDFLFNGSRIYLDLTRFLETATAECRSARSILTHEKWSERFLSTVIREFRELQKNPVMLALNKKNSDPALNHSRGCHESYLTDLLIERLIDEGVRFFSNCDSPETKKPLNGRTNYLILFLIVRQILTGSGGIMLHSNSLNQGKDAYEISPRTHFIGKVFSGTSTEGGSESRPIIHTRKEPWADNTKYFRLHLILGDANMAHLPIFLKFGTTSAILEMIEEGFYDKSLNLANPGKAVSLLRAVSKDLEMKNVPIVLVDGKSYNVLEIHEMFCRNFERYLEYTGQGGEKSEVLGRWKETVSRLKMNDERVNRQLDWKIKWERLIKPKMSRDSLPIGHNHLVIRDLQYHNPNPQGLYYMLENRSFVDTIINKSKIAEGAKPPLDTRAFLRFFLQRFFEKTGLHYETSWDEISFATKFSGLKVTKMTLKMPDPFCNNLSGLDINVNRPAIEFIDRLNPEVFGKNRRE